MVVNNRHPWGVHGATSKKAQALYVRTFKFITQEENGKKNLNH